MSKFAKSFLNLETRSKLLDLLGELTTITTYVRWAMKTGTEAEEQGEKEKVDYYEALMKAIVYSTRRESR